MGIEPGVAGLMFAFGCIEGWGASVPADPACSPRVTAKCVQALTARYALPVPAPHDECIAALSASCNLPVPALHAECIEALTRYLGLVPPDSEDAAKVGRGGECHQRGWAVGACGSVIGRAVSLGRSPVLYAGWLSEAD